MAKIVVYSMAYRGDVFPYVPIASGLARAGHDVVFVVPEEYHPLFAAEPFRCASSGTDYGPKLLDQHAPYVARWGKRFGGGLMLHLYFGELTIPYLPQLHAALEAEVADADLLFSHPAAAVSGSMAAELHDVPLVVGDLFPMIMLSEYDPISSLPYPGRRVNRMLIRGMRSRLMDPMFSAKGFRAFRRQLGLSNDGWNVMDARLSPLANLALVPSAYYPPRPDWPDNYTMVGFTPWEGPDGGRLDSEVTEFLDAGDAPVVVTLGTSAASAQPQVFDQALAALDAHRERAVVLASNDDLAADLAQRVGAQHLVRPFIPLAPLLRRSKAIVHSGAHGTNSLALLAGVPSVIAPCLFDQVSHGRRQQELGTGAWVRRKRDLPKAVATILNPANGYTERAQAFSEQISQEDGTARTITELERILDSTSS
ncbi:MAG: nucleotide disphospho-sugar-binding domain-containing protein [Candidatus Microthrix parvicella]|jgi:rhamnosyltransferase subunit B